MAERQLAGGCAEGLSTAYAGFERQKKSWGTPAAFAAAKKLAAAGGYHGQPIVLATLAGDATLAQVAGLIQGWAREAGLNVQIKPMQPLAYSNASYNAKYRAGLDLLIGVTFNNAAWKRAARTGAALGNPILQTEGRVTLVDGILATAVLVALALNAVIGWW